MQNQVFDKQMRIKAKEERWTVSAHVQGRLEQAMHMGTQQIKPTRTARGFPRAMAWACIAAVLVLAVVLIQPPPDLTDSSAVLSAGDSGSTPVPVTVPQGSVAFEVENRTLHAVASFSNHTGDIWLLQWQAVPDGRVKQIDEPTELIWLETGISFDDRAAWRLLSTEEQSARETEWGFQGYRLTAEVLHWLEGEWLMPGSEGYEEQQMLIEDAFINGALILSPGDWPEGTSGEMQLVLPDSYQRQYPHMDALTYYLEHGLLEMAVVESHPAS